MTPPAAKAIEFVRDKCLLCENGVMLPRERFRRNVSMDEGREWRCRCGVEEAWCPAREAYANKIENDLRKAIYMSAPRSPLTGKLMLMCHERRLMTYRGTEYEIDFDYYLCQDTGERFTTTELDAQHLHRLIEAEINHKSKRKMITRTELLKSEEYHLTKIQSDLFIAAEACVHENGFDRAQFARHIGTSRNLADKVLSGDFDGKLSQLVSIALCVGKVPVITFVDAEKYGEA